MSTCTRTCPRTSTRWPGWNRCFRTSTTTCTATTRRGCWAGAACSRTASTCPTRSGSAWLTRGCNIAFCPTSNLFLGSGLFPLQRAERARDPRRAGHGYRRRHQPLAPGHHERGLQGPAAAGREPVAVEELLPGDPRRCPRPRPRGPHRQFPAGQGSGLPGSRPRQHAPAARASHALQNCSKRSSSCRRSATTAAVRETWIMGERRHQRDTAPGTATQPALSL
jgi:hypothetical protein